MFFIVCQFFKKLTFSKNSFKNTIRVWNSLDPEQARHFVWPDLGPNCLQKSSADNTSRQRVKLIFTDMGLDVRKPVFGGLGTTQAQTCLHICAVWSAPLLFAFLKVQYVNFYRWNLNFLASLCSWGDWFETRFVRNPEDRFSRDEAHIWLYMGLNVRKPVFGGLWHRPACASALSDQHLCESIISRLATSKISIFFS